MAKRKVAGKTEVLEHLTDTLRSEEGAASNKMKAAELLGKHLGMFGSKTNTDTGVKVVIVDDIKKDGEG